MSTAITFATSVPGRRAKLVPASSPVFLSPKVVTQVAESVGALPPETGGMLFGPAGLGGCDVFEFDEHGSRSASAVVYRPDVAWANDRQEHHIRARPMRLFDGFVHSHPGGSFEPSAPAGGAEGDMGFAAAALKANQHMHRFLLFIVTQTSKRAPVLWPWVVEESDPETPRLAPVVICEPGQFPGRQFPEEHAAQFGVQTLSTLLLVGLNVDQIAQTARVAVCAKDRFLLAQVDGLEVQVHLPPEFPVHPPVVVVDTPDGRLVAPVRWRTRSNLAVELRLGNLIRNARLFAQEV